MYMFRETCIAAALRNDRWVALGVAAPEWQKGTPALRSTEHVLIEAGKGHRVVCASQFCRGRWAVGASSTFTSTIFQGSRSDRQTQRLQDSASKLERIAKVVLWVAEVA